jgi:nitrate/TMAO reductase-like tetraheme cytochrome c subunit
MRLPRLAAFLRPVVFLGDNPITLLGAALTTGSALTMIGFWALETLQLRPIHPYAGLILFLALPAVFVVGLLIMPLGVLWRRWRLRSRGQLPEVYPTFELRKPDIRHALTLLAIATGVNVALLSTASYQGVAYMDSTPFCGNCHSVMAPEYTAHLSSAHERVSCAECHVGSGASWFVRSKLSGTRQLFKVAFHTYARPIPAPVKGLRMARDTCEQCHSPDMLHGDKLVVRTSHADDAPNTPSTTVLALKIGGRRENGAVGIHGRHLGPGVRISYVSTDERRQVIPAVTYQDGSGQPVEYRSTDVKVTDEQLARGEHRAMDCLDCHNRAGHSFEAPERAVDKALSDGSISVTLPYVRKKSLELLKVEYPDQDTAADRIRTGLRTFYQKDSPETYAKQGAQVEAAADRLSAIYKRNVFPEMRVSWGTYPNNLGHADFPGCFRCHDDNHKSREGKAITQDCAACHNVLAMDEKDPKVLASLGVE